MPLGDTGLEALQAVPFGLESLAELQGSGHSTLAPISLGNCSYRAGGIDFSGQATILVSGVEQALHQSGYGSSNTGEISISRWSTPPASMLGHRYSTACSSAPSMSILASVM